MTRLLIALALMLPAWLGLAAPASFVAASALPTIATYGYDRAHDIDGTDHTAPARGPLQHVPVDVSAGHRPGGDHGSHTSVPRSGDAVNHARSAYGYDSPSASTTPAATPRAAMLVARPTAPTSVEVVRLASGCCLAAKAGRSADNLPPIRGGAPGAGGRASKLRPNDDALGPHTVFRRGQDDRIDKYTIFDDFGNETLRFRGSGGSHAGLDPPLFYGAKPGKGPGAPLNRARNPGPDDYQNLPPGY